MNGSSFWDDSYLSLFKNIIDQSTDALFILRPGDGQVVYANQKSCNNLGYTFDEITQLKIWDYAGNIPDFEAWASFLKDKLVDQPWVLETYHRTCSGTCLPVEVNARLLEFHGERFIISSVRDISERKQMEERLINERNKLEAIMATIEDGITVMDPSFHVLYQNRTHKKKQGDQTGRLCYAAYHGKEQVCDGCLVEKTLQDGQIHKREASALTATGMIYLQVTSCPLKNSKGEITAVIESVRDITQQKLAENSLRESARLRSDLISTAAHEFRTPLASILGYAELLNNSKTLGGFSEEKEREFLGEISNKAEVLSKIIDELLDLSLVEKGRMPALEKRTVLLEDVLGNILKGYRSLFSDYHFRFDILPGTCSEISLDPGKFDQVMENILTNAIKYSQPESAIKVSLAEQDSQLLVQVADQGIGMNDDQVERIFEPFYRADPDNPKIRGLGLGMSVVKNVVEAHGGEIRVASQPGKGTTVSILLPK